MTTAIPSIVRASEGYLLETSIRIPRGLDEVFAFFADPRNLELITPPFVRFRILTSPPPTMCEGAEIDYALRIRGLPVRWRTGIPAWDPPHRFVDTQVRGPYSRWIHEHRFTGLGEQTLVEDRVAYSVPGGRLVHELFVRRDLARIFAYRAARLKQLLPDVSPPTVGAAQASSASSSPPTPRATSAATTGPRRREVARCDTRTDSTRNRS